MNVNWNWNWNWNWNRRRCTGQRKRIALLVSGLLSEGERGALEFHLTQCPACRRFQAELELLSGALSGWSRELPEGQPAAALRARWRQAVGRERWGTPRGRVVPSFNCLEWWNWLWRGRRLAGPGFALVWAWILFLNLTMPTQMTPPVREVAVRPQAVLQLLRYQLELLARHGPVPEGGEVGPASWPAFMAPRSQRPLRFERV